MFEIKHKNSAIDLSTRSLKPGTNSYSFFSSRTVEIDLKQICRL